MCVNCLSLFVSFNSSKCLVLKFLKINKKGNIRLNDSCDALIYVLPTHALFRQLVHKDYRGWK